MRPSLAAAAVVLSSCGAPRDAAPEPTAAARAVAPAEAVRPAVLTSPDQEIALTTLDGVALAASYVPGPVGSPRGVVFLHQLSSSRAEWAPFVDALRGAYHVVALDMRGHGKSTSSEQGPVDWHEFGTAHWEAVVQDLEAATQFLSAKGVPLGGIVIVGSSIGSTAAIRFAGEHPDLGGLVLLSPGLAYRGVATVPAARRYGKPKLVIYSADAEDAARGLEQAWHQELALPQPQPVTLRQVPGKAHGVKMLADDPGIVEAVAAFVQATLAP